MGKDVLAMKAVVGEDALSPEDMKYLQFTNNFERKFLQQGSYQTRDIFDSLDLAWDLLRLFPKDQLKKIPADLRDRYWPRKANQATLETAGEDADDDDDKDDEEDADNDKEE